MLEIAHVEGKKSEAGKESSGVLKGEEFFFSIP
jgi:hypothetical protein